MKLLHADLVEEYYQVVKRVYPEITKGQCNEICSAPFIQTRRAIESGIFINVRLQFFGTFMSFKGDLAEKDRFGTTFRKEVKSILSMSDGGLSNHISSLKSKGAIRDDLNGIIQVASILLPEEKQQFYQFKIVQA